MKWLYVFFMSCGSFLSTTAVDEVTCIQTACQLLMSHGWAKHWNSKFKNKKIKKILTPGYTECCTPHPDYNKINEYATFIQQFTNCYFAETVNNWLIVFDIQNSKFLSYSRSYEDWSKWWSQVKEFSNIMAFWEDTFRILEEALPRLSNQENLTRSTQLLNWLGVFDENKLREEENYGQQMFVRIEFIYLSAFNLVINYVAKNCSVKKKSILMYKNKIKIRNAFRQPIEVLSKWFNQLKDLVLNLELTKGSDDQYQLSYRYNQIALHPSTFIYPGNKVYWWWDGVKKKALFVYNELQYYYGDYNTLIHYPVYLASTIMVTFYNNLYHYLRIYIDDLMSEDTNRFGFIADKDPKYLRYVRQSIASISKFNGNGSYLISLVQISNRIENPAHESDTLTAVDLSLIVKVQLNTFDNLLKIELSDEEKDNELIKDVRATTKIIQYEKLMSKYISFLTRFFEDNDYFERSFR